MIEPSKARARVATRSMTRLVSGAWTFALPTDRVAHIEEIFAGSSYDDAYLDVAHLFDLPERAPAALRKLSLEGHAPYALVADVAISVEETPSDRVFALPDYMREWGASVGVEALVVDDQRFAFLLDVGRLIERHVSSLSNPMKPLGA